MTVKPLGTYPRIRRAERNTDLDRRTWAAPNVVVINYDLLGVGSTNTEMLDFGLVFEGPPFFSYGVELLPTSTLIAGDFPQVTAGVREWLTSQSDADVAAYGARIPFYLGASLWIGASHGYDLRLRLSFEGISMRNVEHFRGL